MKDSSTSLGSGRINVSENREGQMTLRGSGSETYHPPRPTPYKVSPPSVGPPKSNRHLPLGVLGSARANRDAGESAPIPSPKERLIVDSISPSTLEVRVPSLTPSRRSDSSRGKVFMLRQR